MEVLSKWIYSQLKNQHVGRGRLIGVNQRHQLGMLDMTQDIGLMGNLLFLLHLLIDTFHSNLLLTGLAETLPHH